MKINELMRIKQENLSGPQQLRMIELNNNFEYQNLDLDVKKKHMKNQMQLYNYAKNLEMLKNKSIFDLQTNTTLQEKRHASKLNRMNMLHRVSNEQSPEITKRYGSRLEQPRNPSPAGSNGSWKSNIPKEKMDELVMKRQLKKIYFKKQQSKNRSPHKNKETDRDN